jgi:putative intracellular protease/amidase
MSKGKILILGSSATEIEVHGGKGATGQYLNELVVPAMALLKAGYEVVLATPSGEQPHIDAASDSAVHFDGDEKAYQVAKDFFKNDPSMANVKTIHEIAEAGVEGFAGVFAPGGQGPVVDLMQDADAGRILRHFHAAGKPSAFLCHGPMTTIAAMPKAREFRAALIAGDKAKAAELAKGWQYAGYRMTVFSASEEKVVEDQILHDKLFFNMPDALTAAGGIVTTTPTDFAPYVVVDQELITGQNPRSDHPIAEKFIEALDRAAATQAA